MSHKQPAPARVETRTCVPCAPDRAGSPGERLSPVRVGVSDTLSHALHCSWGKYPGCHGTAVIGARFQLAGGAIWAGAPGPKQPPARPRHPQGSGG